MASFHHIYRPPTRTITRLLQELDTQTRELERLRKQLVDPAAWPDVRGPVEYVADEDGWDYGKELH